MTRGDIWQRIDSILFPGMAALRAAALAEPLRLAMGFAYPRSIRKKIRRPHKGDCGFLADPKGFEPLTFWSVARRSIQLS